MRKRPIKCHTQLRKRRLHSGQCAFGEVFAFKHNPNKKGNGNGRPRSPSPTRSPKFQRLKGHRSLLLKVCQEKQADYLSCKTSRKKGCQRSYSCNYWHVPERTKFKAPGEGRFVCIQTQQNLRMRRTNVHRPLVFTFHRKRNDKRKRKKSDEKPRQNSSSREQILSQIGNYTWSHPDRISETSKSKRSNTRKFIEGTASMEESKDGDE